MWDEKNISFIKLTIFINIILLTLLISVVSTASAGVIPNGGKFQLSEGIIHPFPSGFGATPVSRFQLFTQPLSDNTPAPTNLQPDQGNFWVNYTWEAGSGIITDSFNVSHNDLWDNSSSLTYLNSSVGPHGWSNITVWAYNNSEGLSQENISMATQVKNNIPVIAPIGNQEVFEGDLLQFMVTASDADGDTLTFGTDASNGSLDPGTGIYSWQTAIGDAGEYTWTFNAMDNYGGEADETITVTVKRALPILASIDVEPASISLLEGENVTFTAYPKDQYNEAFAASVTWLSSDTTVGTIDGSGYFTALAAGTTTITALNGSVSRTAEVNVTAPMPVPDTTEPVISSVTLNNSTPNTDEDILVTVNAIDNVGIISVAANGASLTYQGGNIWNGTITAFAGTHFVNVSASDAASNTGWNNSTSYTATPPIPDTTEPVINSVTLNNSTPNTDEDILVIVIAADDVGIISVVANGASLTYQGENIWNGTITAFAGTHFVNVSASDAAGNIGWNNFTSYTATTPTIPDTLNSINVTPSQVTLLVGNNQTFIASPKDQNGNPINVTITWSSSNETVGTINSSGTFTALSEGTTTITAANGSINGTAIANVTSSVPVLETITVSPPAVNLSVGGIQVFTAVPKDQNGNPINATIVWSNSNPAAGTINTSGANTTFTAIAPGTTIITAANGSINGTATINVTAAPIIPPTILPTIPPTIPPVTPILTTITVYPPSAILAVGETQAFTATTKDQNGNLINAIITWSSSNMTVGTIDASGKFTAKFPGTAIVNATNGLIKGTSLVTVTKPKLPPSSNPNGTYKGKEGIPISFNGSKSFDPDGSIVSYFWDFGDGTNGTGVNPTHTYIHSGNYFVSLKVTDNDGLNATNSTSAIIEEQVIKIISPTNGENFETSSVEVRGTALSSVSSVQVRVGKGSWENASGNKSWNSTVSLSEGVNTISARANYKKAGNSEETSIIVTYDPPHGSNTGGTGNTYIGTSGGGGGGSSGENVYNIELIEKYDLEIFRNKTTSYWFRHLKNPIMYINITGNTNLGLITTSTELLKDTSTFVNNPPEGLVYKNVNIWVGTSGIATPRNIKEAFIKFRVDNAWISSNGVKGSDITLVKWNGTAWIALETMELSKDDAYTFFQGKTNAFSPFAITTNVAGAKSSLAFKDQEVPIESGGIILGSDGKPVQPARTANVAQTESSGTSSWSIILIIFVVGIIVLVYFVKIKK